MGELSLLEAKQYMGKKSTDHFVHHFTESYLTNISHFYNVQAMVRLLSTKITNKNTLIKSPAALYKLLYDPSLMILTNSSTYILDEYVKDRHTKAQAKKTVEAIYDGLPGVIKEESKKPVDTYQPNIVALLVNDQEPAQVDPIPHLCNEQDNGAHLQESEIISLINISNYDMCELTTHDVFSILKDEEIPAIMKKHLENIYYYLLSGIECFFKNFVKSYASNIIYLIRNAFTPNVIYSALKTALVFFVTMSPLPWTVCQRMIRTKKSWKKLCMFRTISSLTWSMNSVKNGSVHLMILNHANI